ncbi:MAG: hypothetical protein R3B93_19015 [Bacteroidia bacterium]
MFDWPFIISLLSTLASLIMLFLTRQDMNRREQKDQEMFVNEVYKNFQELKLTLLGDPNALRTLAKERGKDEQEMKEGYISSLLINHAYKNYRLYKSGLIPEDLWERFHLDMRELMSWVFVYNRWLKIGRLFPLDFQDFINNQVIEKRE